MNEIYHRGFEMRRFFRQYLNVTGRDIVGFISYNSESSTIKHDNGRLFTETIRPFAFSDSLRSKDVPVCLAHNKSDILGSKAMNNLKITENEDGISFRLRLPQNALGDAVLDLIKERKVAGVSPSFYVEKEQWQNDDTYRIVHRADLIELSLVDQPAYLGSCAALQARKNKEIKDAAFIGIYYEPKTEIKLI